MPNWCSASYAIEGDAEEVKSLYKLMKRLQEQKEPSVPNGFGKTWLGCLVNALGGDYNKIHCRGDWSNLEMEGNILKFTTETAWSPCDETFELVCEKFPTLCYFYQSEVWLSIGQMTKRANTFPTSTLQTYVLQTANGTRNILLTRQKYSSGLRR